MTDLIHGIWGIDISKAKFDVALLLAGKVKKRMYTRMRRMAFWHSLIDGHHHDDDQWHATTQA